jgi:tetratricopeptide (TPR) repeat protein
MKTLSLTKTILSLMGICLLSTALAQSPTVDDLRRQIDAQWKAKDWQAAEATARLITAQPQSSSADWRNFAVILRQQNKVDESYGAYLELIKRPGARSTDYTSICWYLLKQNKPLEAKPSCQNASDRDPGSVAAAINLGHFYLLAGDKTQAQPWYQKALDYISNDEDLKTGPIDDFDLFIHQGWAVAGALASKEWMQTEWNTKLRPNRQHANAYNTGYPEFKVLLSEARDIENYDKPNAWVKSFMTQYPKAVMEANKFQCHIDVAKLPTPAIRLNDEKMKALDSRELKLFEETCFGGLVGFTEGRYALSDSYTALIRLICQNNADACDELETKRVIPADKSAVGFKWALTKGRSRLLEADEIYYKQYTRTEKYEIKMLDERRAAIDAASLAEAKLWWNGIAPMLQSMSHDQTIVFLIKDAEANRKLFQYIVDNRIEPLEFAKKLLTALLKNSSM